MEIREITLPFFVSSLVVIGKPYEHGNVLMFYTVDSRYLDLAYLE